MKVEPGPVPDQAADHATADMGMPGQLQDQSVQPQTGACSGGSMRRGRKPTAAKQAPSTSSGSAPSWLFPATWRRRSDRADEDEDAASMEAPAAKRSRMGHAHSAENALAAAGPSIGAGGGRPHANPQASLQPSELRAAAQDLLAGAGSRPSTQGAVAADMEGGPRSGDDRQLAGAARTPEQQQQQATAPREAPRFSSLSAGRVGPQPCPIPEPLARQTVQPLQHTTPAGWCPGLPVLSPVTCMPLVKQEATPDGGLVGEKRRAEAHMCGADGASGPSLFGSSGGRAGLAGGPMAKRATTQWLPERQTAAGTSYRSASAGGIAGNPQGAAARRDSDQAPRSAQHGSERRVQQLPGMRGAAAGASAAPAHDPTPQSAPLRIGKIQANRSAYPNHAVAEYLLVHAGLPPDAESGTISVMHADTKYEVVVRKCPLPRASVYIRSPTLFAALGDAAVGRVLHFTPLKDGTFAATTSAASPAPAARPRRERRAAAGPSHGGTGAGGIADNPQGAEAGGTAHRAPHPAEHDSEHPRQQRVGNGAAPGTAAAPARGGGALHAATLRSGKIQASSAAFLHQAVAEALMAHAGLPPDSDSGSITAMYAGGMYGMVVRKCKPPRKDAYIRSLALFAALGGAAAVGRVLHFTPLNGGTFAVTAISAATARAATHAGQAVATAHGEGEEATAEFVRRLTPSVFHQGRCSCSEAKAQYMLQHAGHDGGAQSGALRCSVGSGPGLTFDLQLLRVVEATKSRMKLTGLTRPLLRALGAQAGDVLRLQPLPGGGFKASVKSGAGWRGTGAPQGAATGTTANRSARAQAAGPGGRLLHGQRLQAGHGMLAIAGGSKPQAAGNGGSTPSSLQQKQPQQGAIANGTFDNSGAGSGSAGGGGEPHGAPAGAAAAAGGQVPEGPAGSMAPEQQQQQQGPGDSAAQRAIRSTEARATLDGAAASAAEFARTLTPSAFSSSQVSLCRAKAQAMLQHAGHPEGTKVGDLRCSIGSRTGPALTVRVTHSRGLWLGRLAPLLRALGAHEGDMLCLQPQRGGIFVASVIAGSSSDSAGDDDDEDEEEEEEEDSADEEWAVGQPSARELKAAAGARQPARLKNASHRQQQEQEQDEQPGRYGLALAASGSNAAQLAGNTRNNCVVQLPQLWDKLQRSTAAGPAIANGATTSGRAAAAPKQQAVGARKASVSPSVIIDLLDSDEGEEVDTQPLPAGMPSAAAADEGGLAAPGGSGEQDQAPPHQQQHQHGGADLHACASAAAATAATAAPAVTAAAAAAGAAPPAAPPATADPPVNLPSNANDAIAGYGPAAADIMHLHGCLPPGVGLPPLQPGELRVCGLTLHPSLAPGVRRAMDAWLQRHGPELALVRVTQQVQLAPASEAAAAALGLRPMTVVYGVAQRLGLVEDESRPDGGAGAALPLSLELDQRLVEPCRDELRGGRGLAARCALRKGTMLGVAGGYVMPEAEAEALVLRGWGPSRYAQRCPRPDLPFPQARWKLLASSFMMPLPDCPGAAEAAAGQVHAAVGAGGTAGEAASLVQPAPCSGSSSQLVLSQLGYGNMAALVNDPRVNPREWQDGNDIDMQEGAAAGANVAVLPVLVRGLALPVLVVTEDVAPGQQLMRDYGAGWWRRGSLVDAWSLMEEHECSWGQVVHGL